MNVHDALTKMPQSIRELENNVWSHKVDTEALRLRAKVIEADIEAWAAGFDEAGKKRFANEALRGPAIRERLREHEEHTRILDVVKEREVMQQKMESTLAYYHNVQRNARAIAFNLSAAKGLLDLDFADGGP